MELTIGLDVGTSSVKCLAINASGNISAMGWQPLELEIQDGGRVEQNPQRIWNTVSAVCREVSGVLGRDHKIMALSISSQGGTTIPLDASGKPTRAAFSWMDKRASTESSRAEQVLGADRIYRRTGWPLSHGLPINHIAWFQTHQPDEFARSGRFCFVNDYIQSRFCGEYVMDPSSAGITQLYNLSNNAWDDEYLSFVGIDSVRLSPIQNSGEIVGVLTSEASEATGLPVGLPVVNGAHDQYCGALGTGTTRPGNALLSGGTAWVVLAVFADVVQAFNAGMSVSRHALEGVFGGIQSMGGVGASMDWLMDLMTPEGLGNVDKIKIFNHISRKSAPGANGLVFAPLSGGHSEAELPRPGGLYGLSLRHTRADVVQALMEGIAFELRWMLEDMNATEWIDSLVMMSGAARSVVWPRILTDIIRIPITVSNTADAAAWGAARLAALGIGMADPESISQTLRGAGKRIEPNPDLMDFYLQKYEQYKLVRMGRVDDVTVER